MTLDQEIQIWVAVGTWLSSIGTIGAVIVALYLARRVENVRLNVRVGLMEVVIGDGSPLQEHVGITVTNLGERPVTGQLRWLGYRQRQNKTGCHAAFA
jgi:hypothetical protein